MPDAQVTDAAVRHVMRRLAEASQQQHLPAFKRCLSRTALEARRDAE